MNPVFLVQIEQAEKDAVVYIPMSIREEADKLVNALTPMGIYAEVHTGILFETAEAAIDKLQIKPMNSQN
jgi:hypothetical protein